MTAATTQFDIRDLSEQRQLRIAAWDKAFKANYRSFSEKLAHAIYNKVMAEVKDQASNPFLTSSHRVSRTSIVVNITNPANARVIRELIKMEKAIPPFTEWLNEFASQPDESAQKRKEYNYSYFEKRMDDVFTETAEQLKKIFAASGAGDLQYKVRTIPKGVDVLEYSYESQIIVESPTAENNPPMEADRDEATRRDLQRTLACYHCVVVIASIILFLFIEAVYPVYEKYQLISRNHTNVS